MGFFDTNMDEEQLEFFNERAAIYEHLGEKEREEAERLARADTEAYRHSCEIRSIVRMYREHGGDRVKNYLLQVEKHRGSQAAERLRREALDKIGLGKTTK